MSSTLASFGIAGSDFVEQKSVETSHGAFCRAGGLAWLARCDLSRHHDVTVPEMVAGEGSAPVCR